MEAGDYATSTSRETQARSLSGSTYATSRLDSLHVSNCLCLEDILWGLWGLTETRAYATSTAEDGTPYHMIATAVKNLTLDFGHDTDIDTQAINMFASTVVQLQLASKLLCIVTKPSAD